MWEMQEDFYLVLFIFASQLYFYVLSPSILLGYSYFDIWKQFFFFFLGVIRQLGFS